MNKLDLNMQLFDRVMRLPQALRMRLFQPRANGPEGTLERPGEQSGAPWRPMPRPGMPFHQPGPGGRRGPGGHRGPEGFGGPGGHRGPGGPGEPEDFDAPAMRGPQGPMGRPVLSRERALSLLLDNENGLRQKDIGEKLHIGPSATSEFVDRLREEGYVERRVDPDDRRATRVVLTELGRARACELQDEQNERLEQLFGRLTDDEKRQLIALIDKLLGAPVRPGPSGEMYRM